MSGFTEKYVSRGGEGGICHGERKWFRCEYGTRGLYLSCTRPHGRLGGGRTPPTTTPVGGCGQRGPEPELPPPPTLPSQAGPAPVCLPPASGVDWTVPFHDDQRRIPCCTPPRPPNPPSSCYVGTLHPYRFLYAPIPPLGPVAVPHKRCLHTSALVASMLALVGCGWAAYSGAPLPSSHSLWVLPFTTVGAAGPSAMQAHGFAARSTPPTLSRGGLSSAPALEGFSVPKCRSAGAPPHPLIPHDRPSHGSVLVGGPSTAIARPPVLVRRATEDDAAAVSTTNEAAGIHRTGRRGRL